MLFKFLVVVQALVGAAMLGVILMQKSEGGGLGVGGSPSGLMSARGAADFLIRATSVLAFLFVTLSIALAGLASVNHTAGTIDDSLSTPARPVGSDNGVPLGETTAPAATPAPAEPAKPASDAGSSGVPIE